jgi:hypothetical protein
VPGAFLRDHQLDQITADACRMDNRKLAARDVSYFSRERTALCADALPDFHLVRFCRAKSNLPWNHNDGFASFSRSFCGNFRPRLVGFLIQGYILQELVERRVSRSGQRHECPIPIWKKPLLVSHQTNCRLGGGKLRAYLLDLRSLLLQGRR